MDKKNSASTQRIYDSVLEGIKPSTLEVQNTIASANTVMARLKRIVPKDVELMVVGSIARSTNLKGDHDIDIFMLFDKRYKKEQIERLGLEFAKRIVEKKNREGWEIKYAEHPYTRVHLDKLNIKVDIVPAYKIENVEQLATAVDRTPFHTRFMNDHLSDRQRDEVRVLKYMLKNHRIYGAEVKIKGFSGYLCELLVYSFGSLDKLFEEAANFKLPLYINPLNMDEKGNKEIFRRFGSEFVLIDPVDKNRNVAAGVSTESLARFVYLTRRFLEKPSKKLLLGDGFDATKAHRQLLDFVKMAHLDSYLIINKVPDKSEDIVWPQLKKTSDIIVTHLKKFGFEVYLNPVWIDKRQGFMLFLSPRAKVGTRLFVGPSLFQKDASGSFLKAHEKALGIFLIDDKIGVLDHNKYEDAKQALVDIIGGKIFAKRKDVSLKGSKMLVNTIPPKYSEYAYFELRNRLKI